MQVRWLAQSVGCTPCPEYVISRTPAPTHSEREVSNWEGATGCVSLIDLEQPKKGGKEKRKAQIVKHDPLKTNLHPTCLYGVRAVLGSSFLLRRHRAGAERATATLAAARPSKKKGTKGEKNGKLGKRDVLAT